MKQTALAVLLTAVPALAADLPTIEEIYSIARPASPAVSPDGERIAYQYKGEIRVVGFDGSGDRSLAKGSAPAWSPDGGAVAYIAADGEDRQIWTVPADGGSPRALTDHDGFIDRFLWSPQGDRIAFLARPRHQADLRFFVSHGVPGEPTVVDKNNLPRNRLWIVDLSGGEERAITADDYSVGGYEQWFADGYSWSPDGGRIAFSKRPHAKAGSHLDGEIAVVDVDSGEMRVLARRDGMDGYPQWSPDGAEIAFITTERRDWVTVSHIYSMDPGTGDARKLTPGFDEKIHDFYWADRGRRILFLAGRGVSKQVFALDVAAREVDPLTDGDVLRGGLAVGADGRTLSWTEESPASLTRVMAARLDSFRPKPVTPPDAEVARWPAVDTEIVRWKSFDGMEIEGIVHKPVGFREGVRAPMLVVPHGGPHSVMTNGFVDGEDRVFAQRGWLVFRPNFRGSGHYGEKFLRANLGGWGIGDYQDVMSGVDYLIEKGWADADRLAVAGASYGGYMTSWTISQTNRFKAAVIGAAITDLASFIRTTDVPDRFEDYLGRDQRAYARSSPMHYATNMRTPSLIWHGDGDIRVPLMQGRHLYTALLNNDVPAEFVIYHGEAHGVRRRSHVLDLIRRKVEWLERWTLGR